MLALHHDPEGRLSSLLLDKVALLDPHRLKQISAAIFAHAALDILEGTGLVLRKVWAEFVTVILSGFFLPFEFMALARHVTWLRVGVTAVNVAVVIYLIFHLRMKLRERQLARA
jgi:uncharacterized membrane protein (DUF2068 family)